MTCRGRGRGVYRQPTNCLLGWFVPCSAERRRDVPKPTPVRRRNLTERRGLLPRPSLPPHTKRRFGFPTLIGRRAGSDEACLLAEFPAEARSPQRRRERHAQTRARGAEARFASSSSVTALRPCWTPPTLIPRRRSRRRRRRRRRRRLARSYSRRHRRRPGSLPEPD